jgi:hypothetical protein
MGRGLTSTASKERSGPKSPISICPPAADGLIMCDPAGRVAEWLKAPDSKSKKRGLPPLAMVDFLNVYRGFVTFTFIHHLLFLALKTPVSIRLQYQIFRPLNLIFGQLGKPYVFEKIQPQIV